ERVLEQVAALQAKEEQPYLRGLASLATGVVAFLDARWRKACDALEIAETTFREQCMAAAWEIDTTQILILQARFWLGDLDKMCAQVPVLVRDATARGDRYATTNLRTAMHFVHLVDDDPERALSESAEAIRAWSQRGFHTQHFYDLVARVHGALYAGQG